MKSGILISICLFIVCLWSSCQETGEAWLETGTEKSITCQLKMDAFQMADAGSRAGENRKSDVEKKVTSLLYLQYDGTTPDAKLATSVRVVNIGDNISLPIAADAVSMTIAPKNLPGSTIVMIANITAEQLLKEGRDISTLRQLRQLSIDIPYTVSDITNHGLPMMGFGTYGTTMTVTMIPLVAKFELSLASNGSEATSIEVENVPRGLSCAGERSMSQNDFTTLHLPVGTTSFYLPANVHGTVDAVTMYEERFLMAPSNATRLKVNYTKESKEYTQIYYPGIRSMGNYTVDNNYFYRINMSLSTNVDENDVEEATYTLLTGANCYMLHPNETEAKRYRLDITRGNGHWLKSSPYYIQPGEKFFVAFTRVSHYKFYEENGRKSPRVLGYDYKLGTVDLELPAGTHENNFLVSVYKGTSANSNEACWSWNLWVTNYNPDVPVQVQADKVRYTVENGEVYRYPSSFWKQKENQDKVLMDRELGIVRHNGSEWDCMPNVSNWTSGYANIRASRSSPFDNTYYQFPYMNLYSIGSFIPVYPIVNNSYSCFYETRTALVSSGQTLFQPTQIAANTQLSENLNRVYINDPYQIYQPEAYKEEKMKWVVVSQEHPKSLYDPCPPGWKAIHTDFFSELLSTNSGSLREVLQETRGSYLYYRMKYQPVGTDEILPFTSIVTNPNYSSLFYAGLLYNSLSNLNLSSFGFYRIRFEKGELKSTAVRRAHQTFVSVRCVRE